MPFAYYGAKHGLATKYPAPSHTTIIEPFAGSAAYSLRWATDSTHVILFDVDEQLVALWHRIQHITIKELNDLDQHVFNDERTVDPLIAGPAGSQTLKATLSGKQQAITPRMRKDWPNVKRRIIRSLPRIKNWDIRHGTYHDAPDIEATWFIDPPYSVHNLKYTSLTAASGNGYRHGAQGIDYEHLSDWCQTRPGQIIVCEQAPANWLPFTPFHQQKNAQNDFRTEVIWTNTAQPQQETLF